MTEVEASPFVKEKVKNEKSVSEQIANQRRSLSLRGFLALKTDKVTNDSIAALGTQKTLKVLKLGKDTAINSLELMPEQQNLVEIIANNTKLNSYKGLSKFRNVSIFSVKDTPMSERPNFRLALLLAFGPRIRIINGEEITSKERMKASQYPSVCKAFVENDWDPTDEPPTQKETMELIAQYQPKKAKQINKGKIKEQDLAADLSPKKTLTMMNSLKKQKRTEQQTFKFDRTDGDDALTDELIDKLSSIGIHIRKDENCHENILKVLKELCEVTKRLTDEISTESSFASDVVRVSQILEASN